MIVADHETKAEVASAYRQARLGGLGHQDALAAAAQAYAARHGTSLVKGMAAAKHFLLWAADRQTLMSRGPK